MSWLVIIIAAIVLILCVAVVAVVLLQSARSASVGGTIAGAGEKFFGKDKQRARTIDEKLAKATPYMAGIIIVLVVVLNLVYLFSK